MRISLLARLIMFAAFGFAASAQTPASWDQWRGRSRDGAVDLNAPREWPQQLTKRWEITVGAGHSSPVIAGTRVIVHTRQGDREVTRALDFETGRELWQDAYEAPYTMNPAARGHGPGPKSTPAIADSRVFTFGISGILSALDLATGRLLWRTPPPDAVAEFGTAMSPIVDGPHVIAHVGGPRGGALTAFDVQSGAVRWRWTGDGPGYASPIVVTIGGTRQLVTQSQKSLIGVSPANGQLLWRVPFTTAYDQNAVTPVAAGDLLVYSGLDQGTTALRVVRKAPAWTTETVWRNDAVPMYMSSPVVIDDTLYGLSHRNRGQFFALDLATGQTIWTSRGREGDNASLMRAGDLLIVTTTNGELIVARPNRTALQEIRRYTVADSAVWAHPAATGSRLLVKDVDKLICWGIN